MKREDLYRSRGTRPKRISVSRTNRTYTETSINAGKPLPLCHWIQLCLCAIMVLLLIISPNFTSIENLDEFQNALQHQISYSTKLQPREWSGSLKEILFMEK